MNSMISKRNEKLAQKVIKGLKSRNMEGYYAASREEALKMALEMLPEGAKIGWGGSSSIEQIGLKDAVKNGNYQVIDRDLTDPEKKRAAELAILDADYLLCSSNAITEDGELFNIDGHCNRIAGIAFGPRHVLMIVGMNKVTKNLEAAQLRARNIAAPCNAQRFPVQTPCNVNGACADCKSPQTICCQFLITRFSMEPGRIRVILVNDELGY